MPPNLFTVIVVDLLLVSCLNVKAITVKINGFMKTAWNKKIFHKNGIAKIVEKIVVKRGLEFETQRYLKMMINKFAYRTIKYFQ